jgi:polyisoprenoid-binding protein YceI
MFSKTGRLGMLGALAILLATPAFAGPRDWKVDSGHSYGEITAESKINQSRESVTLAATRVMGTLRLDPERIEKSVFQFAIDQAGSSPDGGSYTVLRFRSQNAEMTSDGKLRVTGTLTVSQVQLEAQVEGNEAYSGPQFTSRVVKETSREESFVLALPADDPVDAQGQASTDVNALAKISAEDFPGLAQAVLSTNWPAIASDKNCSAAGSAAEDYAGVTCTGSAVAQRSITRTAASFGEDYPGEGSGAAQIGNTVTLALHLRLTQQGAAPAGSIGQ